MTHGESLYLGLVLISFAAFAATLAVQTWLEARGGGKRRK